MADKPIMYAIPNCNTVKKARAWLQEHGVEYEFHDYKKAGTNPEQLRAWVDEFGWDSIVNTRGMTWRKLDQETRDSMDANGAVALMTEKTSIIKRPLLIVGDRKILGFDETAYAEVFG
jgi:arsenate reductase